MDNVKNLLTLLIQDLKNNQLSNLASPHRKSQSNFIKSCFLNEFLTDRKYEISSTRFKRVV